MPKKIVTIGGGNGQSLLLKGLKKFDLDIAAVVSMIDNGGSTGKIREDYHVLPSGDIRRCLAALAQDNQELQEAMGYRFTDGFLAGHNFGNLLMLSLEKQLGGYEAMIKYLSKVLKIKGQAVPVTLEITNLAAELNNGEKIIGETNIDVPKHNAAVKIKRVYLENPVVANPQALQVIQEADLIIYTIGDLYTSVIPNFLVSGIKEAIAASKAKKVFTCNRTTKSGETHGFSTTDFINTIQQYLGKNSLDYFIVDSNIDSPPAGYELVKVEETQGVKMIRADISTPTDRAHINGDKLAKAIWDLCQQLS